MTLELENDKANVMQTLYFCESATWTYLAKWISPGMPRPRLIEAVCSLVADGQVVVEKKRQFTGRQVQIIRLASE